MGGLTGATIQCEPTFEMTLPTFAPTDEGNYTIVLNATETDNTEDYNSTNYFTLEVVENQPPGLNNSVNDMSMMAFSVGTDAEFTITSPIFYDDHDASVTTYFSVDPSTSIFTYDEVNELLTVSATTNADLGDDGISQTANTTETAVFTVEQNLPPQTITSVPTEIGPFYGQRVTVYETSDLYLVSWDATNYVDSENEIVTFALDVPANRTFLTFNTTTGDITIPDDNDKEGNYTLTITARDSNYPTIAETNITLTLELINNVAPVTTQTLPDVDMLALYDLDQEWDYTMFSDAASDPMGWEILTNFTTTSWYTTYTTLNASITSAVPQQN